ncbi:MAG: hypothetical protein ACOZBL_04655 [Patescibacteria group bacterium]
MKGFLRVGRLSIFVRLTQFVANHQRHLYKDAGIFLVSNISVVFAFLSLNIIFDDFFVTTKNLVLLPFWSCMFSSMLFNQYNFPACFEAMAPIHVSKFSEIIFAAQAVSQYGNDLILCFFKKL